MGDEKVGFNEGYIAVVNSTWTRICKEYGFSEVNMWLRRTKFKAISQGSPIFFLEKGSRLIRGHGIFDKSEVSSVVNAWSTYQQANGASSLDEFLQILGLPNDSTSYDISLNCVIVKNIIWLDQKYYIEQSGVNFSKSTVSGKKIKSSEVVILLDYLRTN